MNTSLATPVWDVVAWPGFHFFVRINVIKFYPVIAEDTSVYYPVYMIQPVVKPVEQPVEQPVECLFTRCSPLFSRLFNRLDNRLYRVNGA